MGANGTAWQWRRWLGPAVVVAFFCGPLFIGLDRKDQQSDEAIYSYSVARILETGDWLTPRSIPSDGPFLEKPPLKVWLVAALIRTGVLPFDDRGMRTLDAVFGAAAFFYTWLLARRLAGPVAGVAAVLLLFSYDPLLYEHGIRSNNMEGTLMLAYTGGVYHFVRWIEGPPGGARRHAYAVMLLFVAAFMSKFVAALFLPVICAAAALVRSDRTAIWRTRRREWLTPAVLAAILVPPWFIYESIRFGRQFWNELVGMHVYQRFFGVLVPEHIEPWHYYFTDTWLAFGQARMQIIIALGLAALAWRAWRRAWLASVCLIWWFVPFVLMSLGTSKLFYYAYPFLPPLAIGGGAAAAGVVAALRGPAARRVAARLRLAVPEAETFRPRSLRQGVFIAAGLVCLALALGTAIAGPLTIETDELRLFRNSSVTRPVALAAVLWYFANLGRSALTLLGTAVLTLVLPVAGYAHRVDRFSWIEHPLRTVRDCGLEAQANGAAPGVLFASGDLHHAFFYYLRELGPWTQGEAATAEALRLHLERPGAQTPVILSMDDYAALGGTRPQAGGGPPGRPTSVSPAAAHARVVRLPRGIRVGDVAILLPGPYEACAGPAARAGSSELPSEPVLPNAIGAETGSN